MEPFEDPLRPQRPPLSGQQALAALQRAENLDGYLARVSSSALNVKARKKFFYVPSVHTVETSIPPADLKEPWPNGQVVWMEQSADGGLPHTRLPYFILLPKNIPQNM